MSFQRHRQHDYQLGLSWSSQRLVIVPFNRAEGVLLRKLRYSVATSLDGFVAGPNGEFDWIVVDPEFDFAALYAGFDVLVMGRKSYEVFASMGGGSAPTQQPAYVYSRTLPEGKRNGVTFVADGVGHVRTLKDGAGAKPIWLWGGGSLFRELAREGLVDGVDVAIIPILLGGGIPLLATPGPTMKLALRAHRLYPATGTVFLEYDIEREN
jgi:dihydrofolate reductase